MIQNIVFDMGQVLIRWNKETLLSNMSLSKADGDLLWRETVCGSEWVKYDRGTITGQGVFDSVSKRLPRRLHQNAAALIFDWWEWPICPMPGMEELIRELKEKGYGIYLLSNANIELREHFHKLPAADCFDGIFVSSEHKLLKPQHEIYEKFLSSFSLEAGECFFIDDGPANIEGAEETGIPGTVFREDIPRLRRELREAGINCSEK
ncbi:MAG: HAD family hydrolase [Candidatus Limivicinus sp.]|jgi:putative hydrolase of the HAD superfamily